MNISGGSDDLCRSLDRENRSTGLAKSIERLSESEGRSVPESLWLQVGSIGAGGILVIMVLDRVTRLISLMMKGRACRRNGNGQATPTWRVAELLAEILGTLQGMRRDLIELRREVKILNGTRET